MTEAQSKLEEAVRAYFGQSGFRRFLAALRAKFQASDSRPRGYVELNRPTEEEFEALDGFYGTYTPDRSQSVYRYSIRRFERLMLASRFQLSIPELLRILYGPEVRTRGQQRAATAESWEAMIREAMEPLRASAVQAPCGETGEAGETERELLSCRGRIAEWIEGMREETSPGVRILRKLFASAPEEARHGLTNAIRALLSLAEVHARSGLRSEREPIRLPVLSAQVTGDAHALDWRHPLGRLFWWGLVACFHSREAEPFVFSAACSDMEADEDPPGRERSEPSLSQAQLIREGYRRGGVADDDLSSQVMFFAPGWDLRWEERVLTLRQVEKMAGAAPGTLRCSALFAVENPSVFAVLTDAAVKRYEQIRTKMQASVGAAELPLLVCVNGQPSVAVVKLLELVLGDPAQEEDGPQFLYSGDLDVKGLEIALGLQQRFTLRYRPWRMNSGHYNRHSHRGIPLTEAERLRLEAADIPWEPKLGSIIAAAGFKLHQELWVNELERDWLDAFEQALH
ncbi:TIGR02679 domain-containing protein [Cohnella hongkongensis]|uniref:TIGR02679 domain-containing protein n=1 Tax=Cohnella hongkongensis TaxID=178337 RepID=A0ABV9FGP0_9BACL